MTSEIGERTLLVDLVHTESSYENAMLKIMEFNKCLVFYDFFIF